ncbi:MAG: amidase family protein [Xanthobacteraceae bacterium]
MCWLFVSSYTFSSVFSYLGGEQFISQFVRGLDLTPLQFLILAQFIIFLLGWPLEWSEIIIIFVPIFLPLLGLFDIDPLFFGILVALNLQTSFLTPPMAMSAYYLKGIAPPQVQLIQIFRGVMPFLLCVFISMAIVYVFPRSYSSFRRCSMGVEPGLLDAGAAVARAAGDRRAALCRAGRGLCRAHRSARERREGLGVVRSRAPAQAGRCARRLPGNWASDRCAAQPAGGRCGRDRHRRHPDLQWHTHRAGRVPLTRCRRRRALANGALIVGKTRTPTTELAFTHPGDAANPINPEHTPGCGAAAAVAAGMVPLALGTQTAGSIVGPASYCGVVGLKPTFGAIGRRGVLAQAPSLDTVGVFARDPEGAALLAEALFGHHPQDRATNPVPHPRLLSCVRAGAPSSRHSPWFTRPYWRKADAEMRENTIEELAGLLGERCFVVELPELFAEADAVRQRIQFAELAKCFIAIGSMAARNCLGD